MIMELIRDFYYKFWFRKKFIFPNGMWVTIGVIIFGSILLPLLWQFILIAIILSITALGTLT